jgi:hypothetical protein
MARYFKAPVVQPIDYGYDLPFEQIYGALALKQRAQDENMAGAQKLYAAKKDALSPDDPLRNAVVMGRNKRVESIMYDENGKVKDLTSASGQIQAEARRQAAEDQRGGVAWAVENMVKVHDDYEKSIDDLHKNGKINDKQKDFLKARSFTEYDEKGGLGMPGKNGTYDERQLEYGITPAQQVNLHKLGDEMGKVVGKLEIQAAGWAMEEDPKTGFLKAKPTARWSKEMNGQYNQTGTVTMKTYDKIYGSVKEGLSGDDEVLSYLAQMAQANGVDIDPATGKPYTDAKVRNEKINQYVHSEIENEARRSAYGQMEVLFDPSIHEDWMLKERIMQANRIAAIDYEQRAKELATVIPTLTQQNNVKFNANDLKVARESAETSIKTTGAALNDFLKLKGNDPNKMSADDKNAYLKLKAANEAAIRSKEAVNSKEKLILDKAGTSVDKVAATTIWNSLQTIHGTKNYETRAGDPKALEETLIKYIAGGEGGAKGGTNVSGYDIGKIRIALRTGDTSSLNAKQKERVVELASGKAPSFLSSQEPLFNNFTQTTNTNWNTNYGNAVSAATNKVNASGGLNYQETIGTVFTTDIKGKSVNGVVAKQLGEEFEKTGFAGLTVASGGHAGAAVSSALFIGPNEGKAKVVPGTVVVNPSTSNNTHLGAGGATVYTLTALVDLGDGKKEYRNIPVNVDNPDYAKSLDRLSVEGGTDLILNSVNLDTEDARINNFAVGAQQIGSGQPIVKAVYNTGIASADVGETREIRNDFNVVVGTVTKTPSGYQFTDHNGSPVRDTRILSSQYGTLPEEDLPTTFSNLSDFTQTIGEALVDSDQIKNTFGRGNSPKRYNQTLK